MYSRGVIAALAFVLGACDSGGMEIVVYAPADPGTPAPHTVKLYIGLGDAQPAALAPAGTFQRFSTMKWDRDPANGDDTTEYGDGPARFLFRPGGDIDRFGVVIAVGFDANGTPESSGVLFDLEMGNARIKRYSVGLNKITNAVTMRGGYNALYLWGPGSRNGAFDDACVFTQNTYPDPTPSSAFIVRPGDRDCDGIDDAQLPPECDPNIWFAHRTAMRHEVSCLLIDRFSQATSETACLLGGPTCTDGTGMDTSCTATKYCAHPTLCQQGICGVGPTAWDCAKDVRSHLGGMGNSAGIDCQITVKVATGGNTSDVCTLKPTFDLKLVDLPPAAMCTRIQVRDFDNNFDDRIRDGMAEYKFTVDSACTVTIEPSGFYTDVGGLPAAVSGLVTVDFGPNMHGLAIPFVITLERDTSGQCAPPTCTLVGPPTDQFRSCIAAPPPL